VLVLKGANYAWLLLHANYALLLRRSFADGFREKVCGGITVFCAVGWRVAVKDGACGSCHVSAGTWCVVFGHQ
jgi:hypothetical protein